jgi:hypothetical protein
MPYSSAKQANLMRAVAHNPSFAKKVGIPQSVGQKFETHKAEGGIMKESPAMMKKEVSFMKKKGAPKSMIKHEMAEAKGKKMMGGGMAYAKGGGIESKGKTKGKQIKMAMGGKAC